MDTSRTPAPGVAARRRREGGRSPWSVPLAVLLVLVGVFATGAGLGRSVGPLDWAASGGHRAQTGGSGGAGTMAASRPVSLAVPAIDVRAPVAPVGQARDGSIAVPPLERHHETGWYDRGPTPGEPGWAVIVGHVDTRSGPSVFHDLGRLRPGDPIEVTRADGSVVVFSVDSVEHFPKDRLPAERVYGDEGPPGLRLITCGGDWVGGGTGYADNVIAFASLLSSRAP
ncbi:Sortase family protein [Micromonospora nigra]|uniref:Sortase family protein n=1 Tax=Micromonospora nigra TaxID=145857 RepID=A0A1C6STB1_9ACTN|nr:class F sortase [Micromonospora nigra]SCL32836.1 Sortase family protein [Micromonospora nigra]